MSIDDPYKTAKNPAETTGEQGAVSTPSARACAQEVLMSEWTITTTRAALVRSEGGLGRPYPATVRAVAVEWAERRQPSISSAK